MVRGKLEVKNTLKT